jgi:20S proteasome alpha/beta subunit
MLQAHLTTALAKNGVVLATEKKLPLLMDSSSVEKISLITDNIGIVYSGLGSDTRVLVRKGRKRAQKYFRVYHEPIPVNQLVKELASIMQEFTQSGYLDSPPFKKKKLIFVLNSEVCDHLVCLC